MAIEDIDAKIADIKSKHEAATVKRLRAEATRDAAEEKIQALREELEEVYGVSSVEDALELLKVKKARLDELLEQAEKDLESA